MAQPVHIALTFTDSHWALAYTVMRSASVTSQRPQDLYFHLCHEHLADDHRVVLESISSEFGAKLFHYDLTENESLTELSRILRTNSRWPRIVYARLILDRIVAKDISRILYLDSDVLVLEDLVPLYNTDLGVNALAAVQDIQHIHQRLGRDLRAKRHQPGQGVQYFNSGVLLIDLKALANADILAFSRQLASRMDVSRLFFDQELANIVFARAWKRLDWRYNVMAPMLAHEALGPAIVHFTEGPAPWRMNLRRTAFSRLYRHAMTNAVYYRQVRERWWKKRIKPR